MIVWRDRVCVVTGASSGFGRELSRQLASRGAAVVAVARREERLRAVVEELGGAPHSSVVCDVADLGQVRALAAAVTDRWGHVDLLVNNAGIPSAGRMAATTSEAMEQVVRTNLLGAMFCTRELLPLLDAAPRTARTPVVVNVASMAGRIPAPGVPDYVASKFGLVGFSESAWHDLRGAGIRVMVVAPGFAETEGFPMDQLKANPSTARLVMGPRRVAGAIVRGIERGVFEVQVQWWMHLLYHASVLGGPLRRPVTLRLSRAARPDLTGDLED